jgi:hypothetical protein
MEKGLTKEDYLTLILSHVLDEKNSSLCRQLGLPCRAVPLRPSELSEAPYSSLVTEFLRSERSGTYYFTKQTERGKEPIMVVGVPEWLKGILKSSR